MTHFRLHVGVLFLLQFCSPVVAITDASDRETLVALKDAVIPSSIPPFSCLAYWNFSADTDPCRSFLCGISCSAEGRVTSITLDTAGYSGRIPVAISNLSQLRILDLSNNFFYGTIPLSFASLFNLQSLVLTSNSFTGPIPFPFYTNLSSLQTLELSRNSFSGTIPASLSSLSTIAFLDLSYNRLTGPLPSSLPLNLMTVALRGNALTGIVKRSVFEPLRRLEVVDLSGNLFNGKLEGWLFRLPKIQQVNLANNSFEKWEVWQDGSGGEDLVAVDIGSNRIGGELPVELAGYPSLIALTVSHNQLRGAIPWQYHGEKKGASFRRLFLDGNFLDGRVPPELIAGNVTGSFGDNCLKGCPAASALCSPRQKPGWACKSAYSGNGSWRRNDTSGL